MEELYENVDHIEANYTSIDNVNTKDNQAYGVNNFKQKIYSHVSINNSRALIFYYALPMTTFIDKYT